MRMRKAEGVLVGACVSALSMIALITYAYFKRPVSPSVLRKKAGIEAPAQTSNIRPMTLEERVAIE